MKKLGFLACVAVLAGCGGSNSGVNPGNGLYGAPARDARERESLVNTATKDLANGPAAKVAEASGGFGMRLLQESPKTGNAVVSPLSVSSALSMALNGANGETQHEMLEALGYGKLAPTQVNEASRSMRMLLGNVDPSVQLRVANSIWAKEGQPFSEAFLKANEDAYGAKTTRLDFSSAEAPQEINRWVKEATEGRIDTIVDKIEANMVMYLVNAVYFKGQWRTPFEKELTKDGTFTNNEGEKETVPMMAVTSRFGIHEDKGWKAISLPYGNGRIEMVVVLPSGSIDDLVKGFAAKGLPKSIGEVEEKQVSLKMPKFTETFEESLVEPLKKLGMKLAFTDKADFSLLSTDPLLISEVKHKTFIEVDEVGTEAAAVTSVGVAATSAPVDKPVEFVVDRPFAFLIREKQTGLVLFAGAMRSIAPPAKGSQALGK